jgi:hypothetical protein
LPKARRRRCPNRAHAAVIAATRADRLVGHIAPTRSTWDSSAVHARGRRDRAARAAGKAPQAWSPAQGRASAAECRPPSATKSPSRLERQPSLSLAAMLADLPRLSYRHEAERQGPSGAGASCMSTWRMATSRPAVPRPAHRDDSRVAIPLATITASRVTSPCDLMGSACDAALIRDHSRRGPHAACGVGWAGASGTCRSSTPSPAPPPNRPTSQKVEQKAAKPARRTIDLPLAEAVRGKARTAALRVLGRLKDQAGGSTARGPTKVMCHLMFGILVVTVDQLIRRVA